MFSSGQKNASVSYLVLCVIFTSLLERLPRSQSLDKSGDKTDGLILFLWMGKTGAGMNERDMAKEVTITFKCDEAMADWLRRSAFELDKSASEVIRTCILLSLDTVKAIPTLIQSIQFKDREAQ